MSKDRNKPKKTGRSKKQRHKDPFLERERKKYENPIPSREYILEVLADAGIPLTFENLASILKLELDDQLVALDRRLRAMLRDGQVIRNRKQGFCLVNKEDLVAGRVIGHADGFGFLKPDEGDKDLFLNSRQMRTLFDGDRAVVQVTGIDQRGRKEGRVVEILERNTHHVVGRIVMEAGIGFVTPEKKRLHHEIVVPPHELHGAKDGNIVNLEITDQPDKRHRPMGRVLEILGEHMEAGMATDVAMRMHDIPDRWSDEIFAELEQIPDEVPESAKADRVDLRDIQLVTIDGEDARDFDDAVWCKSTPKGWRLLVCIADVSAYVEPESALDKEAHTRGNSVYFPDRVVPMLPEKLSNGLCSLNPDVDRLCMAADMLFDKSGKLLRSKFYPAVMRSHARLTYNKVAKMLEGDSSLCEEYAAVLPAVHELYAYYNVMNAARRKRGAIDFDTTETRIIYDDSGSIAGVEPLIRNDAHRLIEECMLAANVAVAHYLERQRLPVLYRNHEGPAVEKLLELREFLTEFGLRLSGGEKPSAHDYADVLEKIKQRPEAHLIQTVMLRSLAQAVYAPSNLGHFGLSYDAYTHFTSPIRRYPDLMVHRALKHAYLKRKRVDYRYTENEMLHMGDHCSVTERRADLATRDVVDWLKCEFMQDKIGQQFRGIISSVNSFGIFVQLEEIYVDGLVHVTALDQDFYHFDPVGHRLVGERSGQVFRLGDPMAVTLAGVNMDDRKIDFVPVATSAGSGKRKKKRRKKRKD